MSIMSTRALLLLLPRLACLAPAISFAAAADEKPKEVKTVLSEPKPRETPVTEKLAPSSRLTSAIATFVAAKVAPAVEGTEVHIVASSGSMRPAFDDNTVLLSEPAPFGELQVGDIVIYRRKQDSAPIAHRILEQRDGGYWTKGDYNDKMDDELVTEENYLGRVYGILFTTRSGKAPLPDALRTPETTGAKPESSQAGS